MIIWILLGVVVVVFIAGVRIVRPVELRLLETFGKYSGTLNPGFHWVIPIVQRTYSVDITENMVDVPSQFVITKDDLNAKVDAVVYFKVKDPKKAIYAAENYVNQISSLARTTLRDVIGKMSLSDANAKRNEINNSLEQELDRQTNAWGIDIVRVELQEITPPREVVESMNQVVIAERKKIAAENEANAVERLADGDKRAAIKRAEGAKRSSILKAEGQAESIKLVNESAEKYFKGNAVELEKLKTAQISLAKNTKFVIDPNSKITNVISDMAGVVPIGKGNK
jgi:regulator of protease activity HflC (stomatin/prohibitin superfamily)